MSYEANGITLNYKRIGHNQLRVALPDGISASLKEDLRKATNRFKSVTRVRYTREEALLVTVSTRKLRGQFSDHIKSILNMIAAKLSKSQRRVRSANISTGSDAKPSKAKRSNKRPVRRNRR